MLFDLDGTLIDSFQAFCSIANEICKELGFPLVKQEHLLSVVNDGKSFFDFCFSNHSSDKEKNITLFKQKREEMWEDLFHKNVKIFPKTFSLLKELKKSGYKIGIVTSSGNEVLHLKKISPLLQYVDTVVTRDHVTLKKPNPEGILLALKNLNSSKEETLFVGDTPLDIQAGKRAEVTTVGVLSGTSSYETLEREEADFILETTSDLPFLLKIDNQNAILATHILQGRYTKGLNKATDFLSQNAVRNEIERLTQQQPYPGTLNLSLITSSLLKLESFFKSTPSIQLSFNGKYCHATLYPVMIHAHSMKQQAYILRPELKEYDPLKIEIISPLHLQQTLNLRFYDSIYITPIQ
nr:HAD-IA family hydrolase [Halalkalibacterium ligniniphilum]